MVLPPKGSKKRASPDTESMRVHTPGSDRQSKRAKLDVPGPRTPGKPFSFALGSTSSSSRTSGRSLSNLSHALDKLTAPPPSRPNSSIGFVRSEETFARPTASSLKRAATVTNLGKRATGGSVATRKPSPPPSTLNLASSALQALSDSLSSLPQTPTPPKPRVVGTRTGLRSSSAAVGKDSLAANGSKKSSLKVLKSCSIFVDVRTEQGDDAGSLFVDMLKGLGAKIMGRIGQSCTHIVYKNGLPNTLMRYRLLDDPKPSVVGIAWVVECVEKRTRVDEERFKIDVDVINVAGGNNKGRRSMLPKRWIPQSPHTNLDTPMNMSSQADEAEEGAAGCEGSLSQDPDPSIKSRDEDDLPPLERARRRRSILPGGQTRLIF